MKKLFLKFFTLILALSVIHTVQAQWSPKSVTVDKSASSPNVDGIVDLVWNSVDAQAINQVWKPGDLGEESVSFGVDGATFKALWDDDYIYILVEVDDDNHWNHLDAGVTSWQADKPELYFDVNETRIDNLGPSVGGTGHYQFAPSFDPAEAKNGFEAAFVVDLLGPYVYEYAIPLGTLVDKNGNGGLDPTTRTTIGFDITILDLDEPGSGGGNNFMGRINWSNDVLSKASPEAVTGESWTCLDQAGEFIFRSYDPNREEPFADAGSDQLAIEGQYVYLDGSGSYDIQDTDVSSYEWKGPVGVIINNSDQANANFIAPEIFQDSVIKIELTVYDTELNSDKDIVQIMIKRINTVPIAYAGEDAHYQANDSIVLDGSGSSDADNDELTYYWESLSNLSLPNSNAEKIQFFAPITSQLTSYPFTLRVYDSESFSNYDTVVVSVEGGSVSSISKSSLSNGILITPNPASALSTLLFEPLTNPTVQLVTLDGRIVDEYIVKESLVEQVSIDVSTYQKGTYIVIVSTDEKFYSSKLLVE